MSLLRTLVVFFVALNLLAGIAQSTGVASTIGVDATVGGDEDTNALTGENVPTGTSTGQTLFGLYNVVGNFLGGIYGYVYPGLNMLSRAGVPVWLTRDVLGNLFTVMITFAIIDYLPGGGS